MADPTDHLTAVRAALAHAGKATPGPWYIRHGRDGESCFVIRDEPTREDLLITDTATHAVLANVEAVVALRNAAPAIAALADECERLRAAMRTISGIRDSIIGAQALNWSEHVYPLVAALDGAGFTGAGYETARANVGTLLQRIATLEAELAQARAHQCGGIVLSAEDADRIAALLEEQPGPTPALLALFAKAKE